MPPAEDEFRPKKSWFNKFACALRGTGQGIRGQSSFTVHFFVAAVVIVAGLAFGISRADWGLVVIAITAVLVAEMFNSSAEAFARAITASYDENIRDALDIASASVLVASFGAIVIGLIVFVPHLLAFVEWAWALG